MNKYTTKFARICPNAERHVIGYTLIIESHNKIMVEDIIAAVVELPVETFHEDAADQLCNAIPGGRHTLIAYHHGVDIETVRGGL